MVAKIDQRAHAPGPAAPGAWTSAPKRSSNGRRAKVDGVASANRSVEETNRWMLRARDAIDREYARPLDIRALAKIAAVSEAHFIRTFRATFGETPHRYLQRRRVERAMALLRLTDRSVTDVCFDVGFTSLGTFSRTFRAILGQSPSSYRQQAEPAAPVPTCFAMAWTRPSSFGEATRPGPP